MFSKEQQHKKHLNAHKKTPSTYQQAWLATPAAAPLAQAPHRALMPWPPTAAAAPTAAVAAVAQRHASIAAATGGAAASGVVLHLGQCHAMGMAHVLPRGACPAWMVDCGEGQHQQQPRVVVSYPPVLVVMVVVQCHPTMGVVAAH